MAKLTLERRDKLAGSQFGLPKQRKYPMPDASHAANAKARAAQQEAKGNLSASDKAAIDAKANNVLRGKSKRNADPKAKGKVMYSTGDGD